jgi:hypothetical protein
MGEWECMDCRWKFTLAKKTIEEAEKPTMAARATMSHRVPGAHVDRRMGGEAEPAHEAVRRKSGGGKGK